MRTGEGNAGNAIILALWRFWQYVEDGTGVTKRGADEYLAVHFLIHPDWRSGKGDGKRHSGKRPKTAANARWKQLDDFDGGERRSNLFAAKNGICWPGAYASAACSFRLPSNCWM